jgi:hypothetical protein
VSRKAKDARPPNGSPRVTTWSSLQMPKQDPLTAAAAPSSKLATGPDGTTVITDKGKGKARGKEGGKGKAIANPESEHEVDSGDGDDGYGSIFAADQTVNGHSDKSRGQNKAPVLDGFVDTEHEDLYS